jgi:hypothetical protein
VSLDGVVDPALTVGLGLLRVPVDAASGAGAVRGGEPPAMAALAVRVCVVPVVFCGAGAPTTLLEGFEPAIARLAALV